MSLTPRKTLNDDYIQGLNCAICGNPNLTITHVEKYPDFVSCDRCGAAFVVENEGSWVMYGQIPAEYPETRSFALRQWTWLDAVAQRAADEREMRSPPPSTMEKTPEEIKETIPPSTQATPPNQQEIPSEGVRRPEPSPGELDVVESEFFEVIDKAPPSTEEIDSLLEDQVVPIPPEETRESPPEQALLEEDIIAPSPYQPVEVPEAKSEIPAENKEKEPEFTDVDQFLEEALPETLWDTPEASALFPDDTTAQPEVTIPASPKEESPTEAPQISSDTPSQVAVGEPEPGKRFRIQIHGAQPKYPKNFCAHCLRTPVREKSIMRGSLPDPNRPGYRKRVPLSLPFCRDCQKRMNARSDEEKNARMMIFLGSALIAVIAVVALLVFGLIDFGENMAAGIIILLVTAVLGFSIPVLIGLNWANQYTPPRDAALVLSTLLVHEAGEDLTEFEWRNPGYAELFRQVNLDNAVGDITPVEDRSSFVEPKPVDIQKTNKQENAPEAPKAQVDEETTTS
jgi:hypothetical protein